MEAPRARIQRAVVDDRDGVCAVVLPRGQQIQTPIGAVHDLKMRHLAPELRHPFDQLSVGIQQFQRASAAHERLTLTIQEDTGMQAVNALVAGR